MPIPNFSKSILENNEHLKRRKKKKSLLHEPFLTMSTTASHHHGNCVSGTKMWCVCPKTWGAPAQVTLALPGKPPGAGSAPGAGELQAPQYLMGAWSGLAAPTCSEPTSQQHQATPNIWVHLTSAGMSNGAAAPRMRLQMVWGEGPAPETFPLCGQQVLSTNIPGAPAGQRASATERPSQFRHLNLHLHFLPPK